MSIKFPCQHCGKKVSAPESHAGKQATCPFCKEKVDIPENDFDEEPQFEIPPQPGASAADSLDNLDDAPIGIADPGEFHERTEDENPSPPPKSEKPPIEFAKTDWFDEKIEEPESTAPENLGEPPIAFADEPEPHQRYADPRLLSDIEKEDNHSSQPRNTAPLDDPLELVVKYIKAVSESNLQESERLVGRLNQQAGRCKEIAQQMILDELPPAGVSVPKPVYQAFLRKLVEILS
jgi:phage FluMu protein Com